MKYAYLFISGLSALISLMLWRPVFITICFKKERQHSFVIKLSPPLFFSVFLKNLLSQCISEECFSLEDSPFNFESFCIKCLSNPLFSPSVIILRQTILDTLNVNRTGTFLNHKLFHKRIQEEKVSDDINFFMWDCRLTKRVRNMLCLNGLFEMLGFIFRLYTSYACSFVAVIHTDRAECATTAEKNSLISMPALESLLLYEPIPISSLWL